MKVQKLTPKETALAAENHYLIGQYLEDNNLLESEYYDVVVFGFLKAVKNFSKNENLSLKNEAMKEMDFAIAKHESMVNADIVVHSLSEVVDNLGILEDSIASAKDTVDEVLESIQYESLSENFDHLQKQIAELLIKGYEKREIASMLGINMRVISDEISGLRQILSPGYCMAA